MMPNEPSLITLNTYFGHHRHFVCDAPQNPFFLAVPMVDSQQDAIVHDTRPRQPIPFAPELAVNQSGQAVGEGNAVPGPPPESRGMIHSLIENPSIMDSTATHLWMQIECERQMHRLAAEYFRFRHFWVLFLPAAMMTLVSGVLSFVTTSEMTARPDSAVNVVLSTVVGVLSVISTFWQTLNDQLKYGARKEMHASAALDLKTILDTLDFDDISRMADPSLNVNVTKYHDLYSQVMIGCKSHIPVELDQAFRTLGTRLSMELSSWAGDSTDKAAEQLDMLELQQLYMICYNEMYCTIAQTWSWPFALPDAEMAIQKTIERLCTTLAGDMTEGERAEMGRISIGKLMRHRKATHRCIPGPNRLWLPMTKRPTVVRAADVSPQRSSCSSGMLPLPTPGQKRGDTGRAPGL